MAVTPLALVLFALGLLCFLLARRRGYNAPLFFLAGVLSGPFALMAVLTAGEYAVIDDEDDDPAPLPPAPLQLPPPAAEAPAPTVTVGSSEPAPEPTRPPLPPPTLTAGALGPKPLSLAELASIERPEVVRTALVRGDLHLSDEPKTSRRGRGRRGPDKAAREELELDPIAPGGITQGKCPYCEQDSYADWYGWCVRCVRPFPVTVPAVEPTQKAPDTEDSEQAAAAEETPAPGKVLGVTLPRRSKPKTAKAGKPAEKQAGSSAKKPLTLFGMPVFPEKKRGKSGKRR
jgi:hypothetical protein